MVIKRFFSGFSFVMAGLSGFRAIPGVKLWVILPLFIDAAIFIVGVFYGTHAVHALALAAQAHFLSGAADSFWVTTLSWLLQIIAWLLFFIFYLYLTYILASVIGSPFYSVVAEKTLAHTARLRNESFHAQRGLNHSLHMLVTTSLRAIFLLLIAIMLFFTSLLPGLNMLVAFATFVLVSFDMTDYALELKGYHLKQRFQFLAKNLPEFCGMGAFIGLTAFVPGLILLCVPFGVIGATLVVDQITNSRK